MKPEYMRQFSCYKVTRIDKHKEETKTYKDEKGEEHTYTVRTPYYMVNDTPSAVFLIDDLTPGAVEDISHYHDLPCWCGLDGQALQVKLPNGDWWHIDGVASNCTDPEGARSNPPNHKCWVRHGGIGDVTKLHVDKEGRTCKAGAGSIWSRKDTPKDFHGFLHNGHIRPC